MDIQKISGDSYRVTTDTGDVYETNDHKFIRRLGATPLDIANATPEPTETVKGALEHRWGEIKIQREQLASESIVYQGNAYQADQLSRQNMHELAGNQGDAQRYDWIDDNNQIQSLSLADLRAILDLIATRRHQLYVDSQRKRNDLIAISNGDLSDDEKIAAIKAVTLR